jgi:hypothetical protein
MKSSCSTLWETGALWLSLIIWFIGEAIFAVSWILQEVKEASDVM